jgi:hypothetical protein
MARKLTERERFERWAAKVLQTTPQVIHEVISKRIHAPAAMYRLGVVEGAWIAWRFSRRLSRKPAPVARSRPRPSRGTRARTG